MRILALTSDNHKDVDKYIYIHTSLYILSCNLEVLLCDRNPERSLSPYFTLFSMILFRHNDQDRDSQPHTKESEMQP